ncbi:MAG: hypothetical protein U0U09_14590 [Cyclobacteriaceae bacterium]
MASILKLHYFIAFAGIWALGNGLLHDIFVLREGKPFERELIRLLIDGHILIFSGIIYLLCYNGIKEGESFAFLISIVIAIFLLGYCGLIFKVLPSIGTILINAIVLVWLIFSYSTLPGSNSLKADHVMTKFDAPFIIRISVGHFQPEQLELVTQKLAESETKLRPAIEKLEGCVEYYVAIDKENHYMTNVSVWKTLTSAHQMDTLKEMKDLRKEFEQMKIEFIPITNHETLWFLQK